MDAGDAADELVRAEVRPGRAIRAIVAGPAEGPRRLRRPGVLVERLVHRHTLGERQQGAEPHHALRGRSDRHVAVLHRPGVALQEAPLVRLVGQRGRLAGEPALRAGAQDRGQPRVDRPGLLVGQVLGLPGHERRRPLRDPPLAEGLQRVRQPSVQGPGQLDERPRPLWRHLRASATSSVTPSRSRRRCPSWPSVARLSSAACSSRSTVITDWAAAHTFLSRSSSVSVAVRSSWVIACAGPARRSASSLTRTSASGVELASDSAGPLSTGTGAPRGGADPPSVTIVIPIPSQGGRTLPRVPLPAR